MTRIGRSFCSNFCSAHCRLLCNEPTLFRFIRYPRSYRVLGPKTQAPDLGSRWQCWDRDSAHLFAVLLQYREKTSQRVPIFCYADLDSRWRGSVSSCCTWSFFVCGNDYLLGFFQGDTHGDYAVCEDIPRRTGELYSRSTSGDLMVTLIKGIEDASHPAVVCCGVRIHGNKLIT